MATSKTTARKTKTAKKSPAKVVVSSKKAVRRQVWTIGNLLILSLVLYVGLAIAVGLLMQPAAQPVTLTHLTNDALLSQNETSFITADRPLFDIDVRWLLVALLALSTALPLLYLTKLKKYYAQRLAKRRVAETRWVDLAVSSVIMVEVIALLSGVTDLMYLKLLGGFMVTTCLLGWLAEKQNEKTAKPVWTAYGISIFTGLMPWVAIGITTVATLFYGGIRSPWYVYAAGLTAFIGFGLLAWNQLNQHRRRGSWADYAVVERNYVTISTLTKVAFVAFLLAGLLK